MRKKMAQFISIHYDVWRRHLAFFVRFDLCLKCFLIRAEKINKLRFSPDTLQVECSIAICNAIHWFL